MYLFNTQKNRKIHIFISIYLLLFSNTIILLYFNLNLNKAKAIIINFIIINLNPLFCLNLL